MRRSAKIGLGATGFVIGALFAGPALWNWNGYKPLAAEKVKAATGRDLTLGDISVRLLPFPRASVADVRLSSLSGAKEADFVAIKSVKIDLGLLALLGGKIDVKSVTLEQPVVAAETLADGSKSWQFTATAAPDEPGGEAPAIRIAQARIVDGSVKLIQPDSTRTLSGLNLSLSADSLSGPFAATGDAKFEALPITWSARTEGKLGEAENKISAEAVFGDNLGALKANARIGEKGRSSGGIDLAGADLAALLGAAGIAAPGGSKGPFALSGKFAADASGVGIAPLTLTLPFAEAEARNLLIATGETTRISGEIAMTRLDLDALATGSGAASTAPAATDKPAPFALPAGLEADLKVSAKGIASRGKSIDDLKGKLILKDGRLTLDDLAATLPGRARFSADAALVAKDGKPSLSGKLSLEAPDPSGLAEWGSGDKLDPALAKSLKGVKLTGKFDSDLPSRFDLTDVTLTQGSAKLTGGLRYLAPEMGNKSVGVRVKADALDLAPYLPKGGKKAAENDNATGGAAALKGWDIAIDAGIGALSLPGKPGEDDTVIRDLTIAATLKDGHLAIANAAATPKPGIRVEAKGEVARLDPLSGADIDLSARLNPPGKSKPIKLSGTLKGGLDSLAFDLGSEGDADISLVGRAKSLDKTPTYDAKLKVASKEAADLFALFGDKPAPLGALSLDAALAGDATQFKAEPLALSLGGNKVTGQISGGLTGRPAIKAALRGDVLTLPGGASGSKRGGGPRWSRDLLPLKSLRGVDADISIDLKGLRQGDMVLGDPKLQASLRNGVLTVSTLTASLHGGALRAAGSFDASGSTGKLKAGLSVEGLDLGKAARASGNKALSAGTLVANADLSSAGGSVSELVSGLDGVARFNVSNGVIDGVDLVSINKRLAHLNPDTIISMVGGAIDSLIGNSMTNGQTRFSRASGSFQIHNGLAKTQDLALIVPDAGDGGGGGHIDLPRWELDMDFAFRLSGHKSNPELKVHAFGSLDNPQKQVDKQALVKVLLGSGLGRTAAGIVGGVVTGGGSLIGGAVGGALGEILGTPQDGQPQPQQQQQAPQQKPQQQDSKELKPEDLIRGLFVK